MRALPPGSFRAVWYVLLQCAFHAVLPRVDVGGIKLEASDEFKHLVDGHSVAGAPEISLA